jgi:hypothetical protein
MLSRWEQIWLDPEREIEPLLNMPVSEKINNYVNKKSEKINNNSPD